MEYIGWCVVVLMVGLFMGLLIADQRMGSLERSIGVVVKKRVRSYPSSAPSGAWEVSFRSETFKLEVGSTDLDLWRGVDVVPVSKSQYDQTPIGARIYAKYWRSRFLGNVILLDFAVLESWEWGWERETEV